MSIKLTFEIGHSASRKTKPSKEGFTHDWELFVRGNDGNDIGHFVEKVVFNLHESFPKPKRVIKEPPYTVKEAGYAGFVLKIDIYLKNRDEPKKVTFDYDLDLQPIKTQLNEITIPNPADDFKRKCLKGGGVPLPPGDYKNRDSYGKSAPMPMPPQVDIKKSSKRPEETKPNKIFTDLFGAPLKKPDSRALQNSSPNPTKLPAVSSNKGIEKPPSSSGSGSKEKNEKSKHKHSPNKDGKEVKKEVKESEKPKKDKTKDRERSDKKEKNSKRPSSPSPSSMPASSTSSSARNSTNPISLPPSKNDLMKPQTTKQSSTPVPTGSESSFSKKSSKKDKKSHDKERERNEKKESRAKEAAFSTKEKSHFESVAMKGTNSAISVKERDSTSNRDERDKSKVKANVPVAVAEPKPAPIESTKKQHDKDSERKHKHKKKEKSKETGRESSSSSKKEKQHKNSTTNASPAKAKEQIAIKYEPPKNLSEKDSSDSDVDSPPSIKQDSDNSISDTIMQKPPPEIEKAPKKPRERTKAPEKEEKSRKRKKKEDRESSASPPPAAKQARKEISKSPSIQDRPSSSDSAAHHSHMNNNNVDNASSERKISNEYMSELKDLKQKITTLKSNDDLQQVVRLIAATGCYEITKSSFDFDLVQLDRGTVQRLQEFFASS